MASRGRLGRRRPGTAALALVALVLLLGGTRPAASPEPAHAAALRGYAQLPLAFEPNRGQLDRRVRFAARGSDASLALLDRQLVLVLGGRDTLRLRFARAGTHPRLHGVGALPGRVNYLLGSDPSRWRRNVRTFGRVAVDGAAPGVDLVVY